MDRERARTHNAIALRALIQTAMADEARKRHPQDSPEQDSRKERKDENEKQLPS
jgi:hypothetical protein